MPKAKTIHAYVPPKIKPAPTILIDDGDDVSSIARQLAERDLRRKVDASPKVPKVSLTDEERSYASKFFRRAHGFAIDLCRMNKAEAEKIYDYVRQEGTAKPTNTDYADKDRKTGQKVEVSWPLFREIPWDRYDVPDKLKRTQGAISASSKKKIGGLSLPWPLALRLFGRFANEAPEFTSPFFANPSTFKFDLENNTLFPHQVEASEKVLACLQKRGCCYLSLPCGQGKTATALYVASHALRELDASGRPPKVAVCVGTDRILYQWIGVADDECDRKGIAKFIPNARVKAVKGGASYDVQDCDVAVISIKTLTTWLANKEGHGPEYMDRLRKEKAWEKQKASRKTAPNKRVLANDEAKEREFKRRRIEEEAEAKNADPSKPHADSGFFEQFSMVIFDEAHHMPASTFASVVTAFNAKYMLGLTATVYREDGLTKALHDQLGPTAYLMKEDTSKNELTIRSIHVMCRIELPYNANKYSYRTQEVYLKTIVGECSELNEIKARIILTLFNQGRCMFVVTDRKKQIFTQALCEEAGILKKTKTGRVEIDDDDDEERELRDLDEDESTDVFVRGGLNASSVPEAARGTVFIKGSIPAHLEEMAPGFVAKHCALLVGSMKPERQVMALKKRVVFGTYQIIEEALDDPKRDTLVEGMSRGGKKSIAQRIGRITRKHPNKAIIKPCVVTFRHESSRLAQKDRVRHAKYEAIGYGPECVRKQEWTEIAGRVPPFKIPCTDFLDQ